MSDFHSFDAGPRGRLADPGDAARRTTCSLMRGSGHDDAAIYEVLEMLALLPDQDPALRNCSLPLRDHDKEASCSTPVRRNQLINGTKLA